MGEMGHINVAGVFKGGLAAAVIMNISEFILNVPVAGTQMAAELAARNLPAADSGAQIAVFVGLTALLGFISVWLYAAMRPRLGPGPKTAMCAGLIVWTCSYLYSAISIGTVGIHSMGLVVLIIVWSLVEMLIASSVGGYLYREP
jgi:hypothetical protein